MKIGDYLHECTKCKERWFKREVRHALHKSLSAVAITETRYVCVKCGEPATEFKKEVK